MNDIAILTLDQPVTTITPVQLATSSSPMFDGQTAVVMGWGKINGFKYNANLSWLADLYI